MSGTGDIILETPQVHGLIAGCDSNADNSHPLKTIFC